MRGQYRTTALPARQRHGEFCPLAPPFAFHADHAAVRLNERSADRQAQSQSAKFLVNLRPTLLEGFKYLRELLRLDSDAGIHDLDLHRSVSAIARTNDDFPTVGRKLDAVSQK